MAGHADWESQNLRWAGERPLAVHDWDSAVAQPEAVVAGLWVRAFNAKKQRLGGGGPQLDRLAGEAPERAARAGIGTG